MRIKFQGFFRTIYHQLIEINDSPRKTAIGLGLGVFIGNFPGAGPIAALTCAFLFRVNKAAALLGCVLTNTWMSLVTLGAAIRIGAWIDGDDMNRVTEIFFDLPKTFHWEQLTDPSIRETLLTIVIGYAIVSFILGLIVYLAALFVLYHHRPHPAPRRTLE